MENQEAILEAPGERSEWDDLSGRPRQRHYSEPQFQRWEHYSGPLADMPEETARAMLVELLEYFQVDGYGGMPLPPAGLPGALHDKFDIDDPACELLAIGYDYFLEAVRGRSRAMHNRWKAANQLRHRIEREERERVLAEHMARMREAREDMEQHRSANPQLVYFIAADSGPIKIGMAVDPEARRKSLQTSHHEKLTILATCEGGQRLEARYHKRFAAHRLNGEWFERHPDILAEIGRLKA